MNRMSFFTNTIQSAVIVALVLLLLVLTGAYVYTENSSAVTAFPPFPEEHLHLLSNDASFAMKSTKSDFIMPSYVLVTNDKGESFGGYPGAYAGDIASFGTVGATAGTGATEKNPIWAEFERVLPLLAGSSLEKMSFSDSAAAFEYIDRLFLRSSKLYCEFANPLPLAAIAVFFENTYNDSILYKESFFAKFMIMTSVPSVSSNSSGEVMLHIIDDRGNIITATPKTALMFNTALVSMDSGEFADMGLAKASLVRAQGSEELGICAYIPVFEQTVVQTPVYRESFGSLYETGTDSGVVAQILTAFGMNPNNTNRYSEHDGTVGFVESSGQLEVTSDGVISFVSDEGSGVAMSKLLGYTPEGVKENGYSFADTVSAACAILQAIDGNLLGADASLVLETISYDAVQNVTDFGFSYRINGIDIDTGRQYDAVLSFGSHSLVEANVCIGIYTSTGDRYTDIPQRAAYAAALKQAEEQGMSLTSLYSTYVSDSGSSGETAVFVPVWMASYSSDIPGQYPFVSVLKDGALMADYSEQGGIR